MTKIIRNLALAMAVFGMTAAPVAAQSNTRASDSPVYDIEANRAVLGVNPFTTPDEDDDEEGGLIWGTAVLTALAAILAAWGIERALDNNGSGNQSNGAN